MVWRQAASGGALFLVALVALLFATRLEVGTATRPGPGLFPAVLAAGLLLVGAALVATARSPESGTPAVTHPESAGRPWVLFATAGALAVYVVVFERLGFVVATTGLLAFLFGAVARYRLPVAVGAAAAVAFAARLVFDRWLQVRLPPDFWGR